MAITRSSKKQTKIEDLTDEEANQKLSVSKRTKAESKPEAKQNGDPKPASQSRKRKAPAAGKPTPQKKAATKSSKNTKQQQLESKDDSVSLTNPIMINRSPVLQLFGACVAQFVYADLPWSSCLSIGFAISALCAVSKGRAIGMVEPKEEADDDEAAEKEDKKERAKAGADHFDVMGFNLPLKDGVVIMGGQKKPLKEENLKSKYGGDEKYEAAKKAMTDALQSWKDEEDDLGRKAFHMYEKFRPTVPKGQQGWGRKGELNLAEVENVIKQK